jgi:hypothetical protein
MAAEKPTVTKLSGSPTPWTTALLLQHIHDGIVASSHPWTLTNVQSGGSDSFTASPTVSGVDWEINFTKPTSWTAADTDFKVAIAPDGGITTSFETAACSGGEPLSDDKLCEPVANFTVTTDAEVICMVFSDMVCVLFQTTAMDAFPCMLIIGQVVNIFSADLAASPNFVDGTGYFFGTPQLDYDNSSTHMMIGDLIEGNAGRQLRVGEDVWIGPLAGDVSALGTPMTNLRRQVNGRWLMTPFVFGIEGNGSVINWVTHEPNVIGILNHMGKSRSGGHQNFVAKDRLYMDDGVEWMFIYHSNATMNFGALGMFMPWDDTVTP